MMNLVVAENVTLTIDYNTLWYLNNVECMEIEDMAEKAKRLQEEAEWEAWASEWLADPANQDDPNYSDIFKDLYGFRPRW